MPKLAGGAHSVCQGASWAGRTVVVTVITEELPVVVAGFGLKVAVVAAGNPVTLKFKLSAKPADREMITV